MQWPVKMFRLVSEPTEPGLYCGKDGLCLGGVPLLTKDDFGFEPVPVEQLQQIFDAAYGPQSGVDAQSRMKGLGFVARALDDGDLLRAMIASLQLKLPDIDADGMARLARTKALIKFNYNDGENRDWHGRWTDGSAGTRNSLVTQIQALPLPGIAPIPGPFGGGGFPGRTPSKDDDYTFPPSTGQPANDNARTNAQAQSAANDNEPVRCPAPTPENITDRSERALAYQEEITGLPRGQTMMLDGVQFDGCRESDGTMLEAKGPGYLRFMLGPDSWLGFFTGVVTVQQQMMRQYRVVSTRNRIDEWYFAEKPVAVFFHWVAEVMGYDKFIKVKYQAPGSYGTPRLARSV